jgi:deoxyribonuclease-4
MMINLSYFKIKIDFSFVYSYKYTNMDTIIEEKIIEVPIIKKSRLVITNRVLPMTITNPNSVLGKNPFSNFNYDSTVIPTLLPLNKKQKTAKDLTTKLFSENRIGSHIYKNGTLANTMKDLSPLYPRQIVLDDANKPFAKIDKSDIKETRKIVMCKGLSIYTHASFCFNLCKEPIPANAYVINGLKQQLRISRECGFKGVVVHVGTSGDRLISDAINNMRINILGCLSEATIECPLLLETPAGKKSETLTEMKDFIDFVTSFNDRRLGIVCDTCHIFSTKEKILPSEYIRSILYNNSISHLLKLIHLNDSKTCIGSCKDSHATIGEGSLPASEFLEIVSLATIFGVSMVTEDTEKEPSDTC